MTLFLSLVICALAMFGGMWLVDYFMFDRPRQKAVKQLREGQRWRSRTNPDSIWVVSEVSQFLGAAYLCIDRNPRFGMIVPADFVVRNFLRVEAQA